MNIPTTSEEITECQEKFAELIVRECIETMMKTRATQCDGPDEKFGCDCAIMDVKEHFGVEE